MQLIAHVQRRIEVAEFLMQEAHDAAIVRPILTFSGRRISIVAEHEADSDQQSVLDVLDAPFGTLRSSLLPGDAHVVAPTPCAFEMPSRLFDKLQQTVSAYPEDPGAFHLPAKIGGCIVDGENVGKSRSALFVHQHRLVYLALKEVPDDRRLRARAIAVDKVAAMIS